MPQLVLDRPILDIDQILFVRRTVRFSTLGGGDRDSLLRWGHGRGASRLAHAPGAVRGNHCTRQRRACRGSGDDRLHRAGGGTAELCAPDRSAVRHVPHRFPRADAVRPALQTVRLHGRRRQISHDPVSRAGRRSRGLRVRPGARQACRLPQGAPSRRGPGKRLGAADLDDGDRRLYPHPGAASAADSPL